MAGRNNLTQEEGKKGRGMSEYLGHHQVRGLSSYCGLHIPKYIAIKPAVTWEDYVHVLLMESGHVARAAIYRVKDTRHLASTEDCVLDKDQLNALLQGFEDSTSLRREGLWLQEDRYTLTRLTDRRVMVGREERSGCGCVIYRTQTCLLVTCYEDGNHPGGCYTLVTSLGDFLVEQGF